MGLHPILRFGTPVDKPKSDDNSTKIIKSKWCVHEKKYDSDWWFNLLQHSHGVFCING